jgi:hypothetical protein
MTFHPADTTFVATTGGVLLVTAAGVALIVYSMLALIELLPAQLPAQSLVGLAL